MESMTMFTWIAEVFARLKRIHAKWKKEYDWYFQLATHVNIIVKCRLISSRNIIVHVNVVTGVFHIDLDHWSLYIRFNQDSRKDLIFTVTANMYQREDSDTNTGRHKRTASVCAHFLSSVISQKEQIALLFNLQKQ